MPLAVDKKRTKHSNDEGKVTSQVWCIIFFKKIKSFSFSHSSISVFNLEKKESVIKWKTPRLSSNLLKHFTFEILVLTL